MEYKIFMNEIKKEPEESKDEKIKRLIYQYKELKIKYEDLIKKYKKQNAQLLDYITRYGANIDKKIKK